MEKHQVWLRPTTSGRIVAKAENGPHYAYGQTEDEAIVNLAKAMGIKLWNEE